MSRMLLTLLALVLPPLAVFLAFGHGKAFYCNLLLTALVFIPGQVHAVVQLWSKSAASD